MYCFTGGAPERLSLEEVQRSDNRSGASQVLQAQGFAAVAFAEPLLRTGHSNGDRNI